MDTIYRSTQLVEVRSARSRKSVGQFGMVLTVMAVARIGRPKLRKHRLLRPGVMEGRWSGSGSDLRRRQLEAEIIDGIGPEQ